MAPAPASRSYDDQAEALLAGLAHAEVLAAMSPQLPVELVAALLRASRRQDVEVVLRVADLTGRWDFVDEAALKDVAEGRLKLVALAGGVPFRLAGVVDHVAVSLWDVDRLIADGRLPVDVFVARVGFFGDPARFSHGDMLGFSTTALEVAKRVGWEISAHPGPHRGDAGVALGQADAVVWAEPETTAAARQPIPTGAQRAIAQNLAALVPDGATLQLGVGNAPAAAIEHLADKVDLGLHSGILPAQLQSLIARGVVTGRRKSAQPGCHVATGVMGGAPDGWGADVLLKPLALTHHPARLLEHENLWAINSAFQVDLTGQVNAEYVGGRRVASGAGQIDFARAAHSSPSGASVLALPSRSSSGVARIVTHLDQQVTIGGNDVDYVVTEHGVARLRGLTANERLEALLKVAHPDDRPRLRAEARASRLGA